MPLKIESRAMKFIFAEDGKENLITKGIAVLILLGVICWIIFNESNIVWATIKVIVFLSLILIAGKYDKWRNRRRMKMDSGDKASIVAYTTFLILCTGRVIFF